MPEPKLESFAIIVKYVIFDPNGCTPNKANHLLDKMYDALKKFRLVYEFVTAYTVVCDEFECDQKSPNLLLCSRKLRMELVDSNEDGGAVQRHNNSYQRIIARELSALRFHKYRTVCKVVEDYDNIGDLSVPEEVIERRMTSDAQLIFYKRFQKAVAEFAFLGRTLILEKEQKRLRADKSIGEKTKADLLKNIDRLVGALKQNMKKKELAEYSYFAVSLDLIVSL